ncbi:hypothetical protein N5K27_16320 [Pigmentiphaga sp. GD03639]|uniref:hypothetical protein n=1 Tax=unclassified Pigmentiphaga TaxID=2626614 RepID=UPI000B41AEA6|nr:MULTISPECIES: hypothetical protein [unclassified Pigmentiphaga]MDH2237865.1 hypothetical protein [Pigmentiphaga sp. GD03639]OVZ65123.1 hypothetical protein CDO46_06915 [Pigmentiphaga sp. NML030171]
MRQAIFGGVLVLIVLAAWARQQGWIALPDSLMQALLLCLPLAFLPLYLQGLREGELVIPPRTIRRRETPLLFWFVAVFQAVLVLTLLAYLAVQLLDSLAAG